MDTKRFDDQDIPVFFPILGIEGERNLKRNFF